MRHTSTIISDRLYSRLEAEAQRRGFCNIQQFLIGIWHFPKGDRSYRLKNIRPLDKLRERWAVKCGMK